MSRAAGLAALLVAACGLGACSGASTQQELPGTQDGPSPAAPRSSASRLAATLLPPAPRTSLAGDANATGTVEGIARWAGAEPLKIKQLTNTVDVAACGERVNPGSMVATPQGEIANVVIELRPDDQPRHAAAERLVEPGAPPVVVSVTRCLQEPHVLLIPLGASVEVKNDDGILHELAGLAVRNAPFQADLPRYRRHAIVPADDLSRPERIRVSCQTHPWAVSWWVVTGARYRAVTSRDGRFRITGVPAGTWRVLAWHEELGELDRTVDVRPGQPAEVEVTWR